MIFTQKLKRGLIFLFALAIAGSVSAQRAAPFVLGGVDTLRSAELQETRRLNIYLPEGYSPDSAARYPVIYLLDGSADEDFIHVAGLVQFCNFPWVAALPPTIIVGIANVDRRRDFTYPTTVAKDRANNPTAGHSARFIAFVERELQPYIERAYKTNGKKMLIGQSLGGLLATEILFTKPQLFSHFAIVSPSLWWDSGSLLARPPQFSGTALPQVFIAVGREGKIMERDARQLFKILKNSSPTLPVLGFSFLKNRNHATIHHEAVYRAFEFFGKSF